MKYFPLRYEAALKFRQEPDRLRSFAVAILLHSALGLCEKDICIENNGKPYCKDGNIRFSISHSGSYALLGVSEHNIGIDIEQIKKCSVNVSDRIFTDSEKFLLKDDTDNNFFRLWTMKESVSKVTGQGLSLDFQSFCVCPLFEEKPITVQNRTMYGKNIIIDGYSLSAVTENEPDFDFNMIYYT